MRKFLILAKYSNRTVWKEQKDQILAQGNLVACGERIREGGDEALSVRVAFRLEESFRAD